MDMKRLKEINNMLITLGFGEISNEQCEQYAMNAKKQSERKNVKIPEIKL
jgi:hypothetical protein